MQSLRDRIKNSQRGFTLVELVVVIAILGLLAGIIVPTVSNITGTARGSQKEGDRGAVSTAATNYESDKNSKPVTGGTPANPVPTPDAQGVVTVDAATCGCLAPVDFSALISGGYLAELPQHATDNASAGTITGANKASNTAQLTISTGTVSVWNMDSSSNIWILRSDNDYGR